MVGGQCKKLDRMRDREMKAAVVDMGALEYAME